MHRGKRATTSLIALVIGLFVLAHYTINNESMLINLMLYLALAEGVNVQYGFTGYMPFGYAGFVGAGAYGCAIAITVLHWPAVLAVLAGGCVAMLLAVILAPLLRLSGAYFAIASLAAAQATYEVVANPALTSVTQGPYGMNLHDVYAPAASYWMMLAVLVFAILATSYLRLSRFGLSLMALRDNPTSASMAGVNVVKGRIVSWLLSAAVAGLAGGAFAWNVSVFYPKTVFSIDISIFAILFALFGGVGTVIGPLLGAAILYSLYNFIGISNPEYFQFLYGLLIVILVLFLPAGIVALILKGRINVF